MTIIELIDEGDVCGLPLLIVVLVIVGGAMIGNDGQLHAWGKRSATLGFLAYASYGYVTFQPQSAAEFLGLVMRAILAGGLALAASWIVFAAGKYLWMHTVDAALRRYRSVGQARQAEQLAEENRRERAERERERAFAEAHKAQLVSQSAANQEQADRRRADARAAVSIVYTKLKSNLNDSFSEEELERFLATHMGDEHAADAVERRAGELQATLERLAQQSQPEVQIRTLSDLATWYLNQQQQVDALPVEEKIKRVHRAELSRRYAELSSKLLESLEP